MNDEQAAHLLRLFPEGRQDRIGRTFWLPVGLPPTPAGKVVIITAGTSDLPVAREGLTTAQALGSDVLLIADVGVAGIHRLLRHQTQFAGADAIVVVAGMDGALPSVVGGLVDCPVVAVPTSVGYGAAFSGVAPLLTMLNSCSANVVVVNIDSGFKGGYVAALIARRAAKRSSGVQS
jgi:NCAIR mutase (PurE)-related protein